MRIGIYDPYLDDLGGGEKYMMTAASCLSRIHDVDLFWDNENDVKLISKRFSLDLKKVKIKKDIFSANTSFLERAIESSKYDVLIMLSDGSIPFVFSKRLLIHFQQPLFGIGAFSLKDRFKLSRVSMIFSNSYYTKSFNESEVSNVKNKVIYPPVKILSRTTKKENIILNVGRFRVKDSVTSSKGMVDGIFDYKKQSVLIDVFKNMVNRKVLKNWKFVIAVSVTEKDKQKFEKMKKNTIGYPIEFIVNSSNKDLWSIYNKSKIYWHASGFGEDLNKHPEYAEHFGISTVEAMGAGVVPVVIDAGGQKEIVDNFDNGLLWNTLVDLENKTLKVIMDQELWKKLSENAKKKAKKFSENNFCSEIQEMVES